MLLAVLTLTVALAAPAFSDADCVRIREARRIAAGPGEALWPGWENAPSSILLVTDDREFLVYHPDPGDAFEDNGYDSRLGAHVYSRARVFDAKLQATFPVAGVPTVVIGRPQRTAASHTTRWTMTLLHEHFHQWQQSRPDYYDAVAALGLAEDDTTGMWMLNYPFPYDDENINALFTNLCRRLRDAVAGGGGAELETYLETRDELRRALSTKDYAYFSFQLWQEGVARHTEYALARKVATRFPVSPEFAALHDYRAFDDDARQTRAHIMNELAAMSLRRARRTAFYHVGAAEAMLLDRHAPQWRRHYFKEEFFLEKYFGGESRSN